eukprot:293992_1
MEAPPLPTQSDKKEDITLTDDETKRLEECFRDKEFRDLLGEYVREISNPSTKMAYEQYLQQIERDGGSPENRKLMKPIPSFCIKAKLIPNEDDNDKRKHIFINICSGPLVEDAKLTSSSGFDHELNCSGAKKAGLCWQIPYILGHQRFDANDGAVMYDIAFSAATIELLPKDLSFKQVVIQTALEAVDAIQNKYKLYANSKKKYKVLSSTKHKGSDEPPLMSVYVEPNQRMINIEKTIKYKIVESAEKMNVADCWSDPTLSIQRDPVRLKQIYIVATLENVASITEVDVQFNKENTICITVKDNKYEKCQIDLQKYKIIPSSMNASWYKKKKELKIRLNIKPEQTKKKMIIPKPVAPMCDHDLNDRKEPFVLKEVTTKRIVKSKEDIEPRKEHEDIPLCQHKIPMKSLTNNGKSYWVCSRSQNEKCTAFIWNKSKKKLIDQFEIEKREKFAKTVLLIRVTNIIQGSVHVAFEPNGGIGIEFEDHTYKYYKHIQLGYPIDVKQSKYDLNCRNLLVMATKQNSKTNVDSSINQILSDSALFDLG